MSAKTYADFEESIRREAARCCVIKAEDIDHVYGSWLAIWHELNDTTQQQRSNSRRAAWARRR